MEVFVWLFAGKPLNIQEVAYLNPLWIQIPFTLCVFREPSFRGCLSTLELFRPGKEILLG